MLDDRVGTVVADAGAWVFILLPVALVIICAILPNILPWLGAALDFIGGVQR